MTDDISKLWCETDAAWKEFCEHPSDATWRNYTAAKEREDEAEQQQDSRARNGAGK